VRSKRGFIVADALVLRFTYEVGLELALWSRITTCHFDQCPSTEDLHLTLAVCWVEEELDMRAFCLILEQFDKSSSRFRRVGITSVSLETSR
jgi:hypothetical protein